MDMRKSSPLYGHPALKTPLRDESRAEHPKSPCIRQCVLDEDNFCTGCKRTLEEIVAWSTMSANEQRALLEQLRAR